MVNESTMHINAAAIRAGVVPAAGARHRAMMAVDFTRRFIGFAVSTSETTCKCRCLRFGHRHLVRLRGVGHS